MNEILLRYFKERGKVLLLLICIIFLTEKVEGTHIYA